MSEKSSKSACVMIVTGCPGSGKTSVCSKLASDDPLGVHIIGDDFLHYIAHLIPPIDPESHHQNTTALAASSRAARAYTDGGYRVYLDGVFGSWFMAHVLNELGEGCPVHYVVLDIPLDVALVRATGRPDSPASEKVVRKMHHDFSIARHYRDHAVDVAGKTEAAVLEILKSGLASDRFLVSR